jgi:hypothetical protein
MNLLTQSRRRWQPSGALPTLVNGRTSHSPSRKQSKPVTAWGHESSSCDLPNAAHVTIDAAYLETNKPIVREQLQKARVRLARILDTALGN